MFRQIYKYKLISFEKSYFSSSVADSYEGEYIGLKTNLEAIEKYKGEITKI